MIEFLVVMARGRFLNDFSNLPQSSALKALTPGAALRLLGLKKPPTYLHFLPTSLNSLIEMTYLAFFSSLQKLNSPSRVGGFLFGGGQGEGDLVQDLSVSGLGFLIGFLTLIILSVDLEDFLFLRVLRSRDTEPFLLAFLFFYRAFALALASSSCSSVQVQEMLTFLPAFLAASASASFS